LQLLSTIESEMRGDGLRHQTSGRRRANPAKVIYGDTIVVAEQLVRIHGIDAPRTGPDVLVAGPTDRVRHDVIGRP
jgi:endonuclease YncB( thermonuclease family)